MNTHFTDVNPLADILDGLENLKEEIYEIIKGKYKTNITVRFNKDGFPLSYIIESKLLSQTDEKINQLKAEKEQAVKNQDYEKAVQIREQIKELELLN